MQRRTWVHAVGRRVVGGGARSAALATLLTALGLFLALEVPGLATAASPSLSVVQKPGVAPSNSAATGAVPAATSITGVIGLDPNNPAALAAYAQAVVTPSSPMYHHYLAAGQFRARFGPTAATISAVTADLRQSGVTVNSVSANGLLINYTTTAAGAQTAFHTHLGRLRLASGRTAITPTTSVQLPSSIAGDVETVTGLNTVIQPQDTPPVSGATGHAAAAAPAASSSAGQGPSACSAATTDAQTYGGLTDQQIGSAYGVNGLYAKGATGAGQTVDVYELEPFSTADLKTFDTCYFGATKAATMLNNVSITKVDGGVQSGEGSGESILDLDDVSALAPGAKIDVFEAPNTTYGLIDNFNAIVQADNAKIATSSWFSGCETQIDAELPGLEKEENSIFEQAAVQGQTVLEASGDDGSDACAIHGTSPVSPLISEGVEESQPYVMSVGGTTITDATDPPSETVWNDGANFGAGSGGISSVWAAPSWQADSGVPGVNNSAIVKHAEAVSGNSFCGASVCRETPDVSAQADEFTGAVTVYAAEFGGWTTFGGTSSATPLWAAMLADINSTPACVAAGGSGFVLPRLYAIAANPTQYAASFNDVTAGNNDAFNDAGGLFPATAGYDMATGLGSPQVTGPGNTRGLAYYLCASTNPTVPAVSSVSPRALPQAGGTVTITGSDFQTGGTSNVSGLQIGTIDLPQADYSVTGPGTIVAKLPSAATLTGAGTPSTEGAGTYDISVTLFDGQSSVPTTGSRLTYDSAATAVPQVDGVSPSGGANEAGGATVTVYGAGFASGTGTPKVTIGGVPATGVKVLNDSELTAVTPAYSSSTACVTKLDPKTDICQTELQVTTSAGSSTLAKIKPQYEGDLSNDGGSATEAAPAVTEFDYFPTPTITNVTIQGGGLASESGGSVAVITGTGLGYLGIDWVNVGPFQQNSSQDASLLYDSGTEIQVVLPAQAATSTELTEPITVQTLGSLNNPNLVASAPSNAGSVTYAPVPQVTGISVPGSTYTAGPTTGGTDLVINGTGLGDATSVKFTDVGTGEGGTLNASGTTAFTLGSVTPTSVSLSTPADNAGTDQVSVCDVSGCSAPVAENDIYTYYAPGNPVVSSVHPAKGAAGTKVTIDGQNLGYVTGVYFGKVKATTFANVPGLLDSGSTSQITATVPAGTVGAKVNVRVTTLESQATGSGKSAVNPSATFTYTG